MASGGAQSSGADLVGQAKETGEAAQRLNESQTYANRPNQNNAWGSSSWENTPQWDAATGQYVNQWTQNETLNPYLQQQVDSNMRIDAGKAGLAEAAMGRAWDDYSNPMDFGKFGESIKFDPNQYGSASNFNMGDYGSSKNYNPNQFGQGQQFNLNGYGQAQNANTDQFGDAQDFNLGQYGESGRFDASQYGGPENFDMGQYGDAQAFDGSAFGDMSGYNDNGDMRQRAEDAAYGRSASRLDPQWQQRQADFETKMRGQGLTQGDRAYDKAYDNLNRSRNDAYEMARMGATGEGRQETTLGMDQNRLTNQNRWQEMQNQQGINDQNNRLRQSEIGMGMESNRLNEQNRLNQANLDLTGQEFNNAARNTDISQGMQANQMNNQNRQDDIRNEMQRVAQNNQAQQQNVNQGMQSNQMNNQLLEQNRQNQMNADQMYNQNRQNDIQSGMAATGMANDTRNNEINLGYQNNQLQNALRQQDIDEAMSQRNFNMDEAERLRLGTGVQGGPPVSGGQTETIANKYVGGGSA